MLKNQAILEIVVGPRVYQLLLHQDSPLGECFDALTEMRHYIVERIKKAEEEERQEGERLAKGDNCNSCGPLDV
jgi:hypothetical protein